MRFLLLSLIYISSILLPTHSKCSAEPSKKYATTLSPAMKRINQRMHTAIRASITYKRQDLGPLIIFEAGEMKLWRKNKEVAAFSIRPPIIYQQLKVLGHMAFALVMQLRRTDVKKDELKGWITDFRTDILKLQAELPSLGFDLQLERSQEELIKKTLSFLNQVERTPVTQNLLRQYSRDVMPALKAGVKKSAQVQVNHLHTQAQKIFALLSKEERTQIRAYLYGGRGARVGNINIQYLSWLFGENTGKESGRIVFSENIFKHDKAMDVLARYLTERELADLIFEDPNRLDRDLLQEATHEYLKTFEDASTVLKKIPSPSK